MVGYSHVRKSIEMAYQKYGPTTLAYVLVMKGIFSPLHYFILKTLNRASISYQSSIMYELFGLQLEYLPIYQSFKEFMKTEPYLKHISSKMSDLGKFN